MIPAQVDVKLILEPEAMANKYDAWCDRMGYPRPDHYIVTWYKDGTYSIDWNYDKLPDILEGLLITIVKLGNHLCPFMLRRRLFFRASSTFEYVEPSAFPQGSKEYKEAEKQLKILVPFRVAVCHLPLVIVVSFAALTHCRRRRGSLLPALPPSVTNGSGRRARVAGLGRWRPLPTWFWA